MPAASIITTYLNPPFDRKVGFHNALKQALVNAGWPTADVDNYDITDLELAANPGGTQFNSGNPGSSRGFVKELQFNASTFGTIGSAFFTRTVSEPNYGGSGNTTVVPYIDRAFVFGNYLYAGGWDGVNKRPNNFALGRATNGYNQNYSHSQYGPIPTFNGAPFSNGGSIGIAGMPLLASTSGTLINTQVFRYTAPIRFTAINHPEIRGVFVTQYGKVSQFVGICRPLNKPDWWNEGNFPYAFLNGNSSFFMYLGFSAQSSPFSSQWNNYLYTSFPGCATQTNSHNIGSRVYDGFGHTNGSPVAQNPENPVTGKIDMIPGMSLIMNQTSTTGNNIPKHLIGQYSNDIVVTPSKGLQQWDKLIVSPGTEEYTVISTNIWYNFSDINNPIDIRLGMASPYYPTYVAAIRTA